jgi:hypothetical protein
VFPPWLGTPATFASTGGSARTLSDGSSPELPKRDLTGVVGVPVGRSAAEEGKALDTQQGQHPCSSTIALEASRRLRHSSWRLRRKRDGGSRFAGVDDTKRVLLTGGEERERTRPIEHNLLIALPFYADVVRARSGMPL